MALAVVLMALCALSTWRLLKTMKGNRQDYLYYSFLAWTSFGGLAVMAAARVFNQ